MFNLLVVEAVVELLVLEIMRIIHQLIIRIIQVEVEAVVLTLSYGSELLI